MHEDKVRVEMENGFYVLFQRELAQVNLVFGSGDQINKLTEFGLIGNLCHTVVSIYAL